MGSCKVPILLYKTPVTARQYSNPGQWQCVRCGLGTAIRVLQSNKGPECLTSGRHITGPGRVSGKHHGSKIPHFDGQRGLAGLVVRGAHRDVRWLEVKMHPATGVKVRNAAGSLECQVGAAWQWQAPLA